MSKRKIVSATTDSDERDLRILFDEIAIELDNGVYINLTLKPKRSDPKFAEIWELSLPKTDGDRVYWSNGASLTMDEIIAMIQAEKTGGQKQKASEE